MKTIIFDLPNAGVVYEIYEEKTVTWFINLYSDSCNLRWEGCNSLNIDSPKL